MKKNIKFSLFIFAIMFSGKVFSAGWCELDTGWSVVTHGTKSDEVYILGKLKDQSSGIWIRIANGDIGKTNVSLALAAYMAGKNITIYVDSASETCASFPSWAPMGSVRHIRIN